MLLQQFQAYWKETFPHLHTKNTHVIAAVSGGIDSVVLVQVLHQLRFSFSIAHCNFKLRGEESERDEAFVKKLAEQVDVPFWVRAFHTKTFSEENKISIQEAARKLRYNWFGEIVTEQSAPEKNITYVIATAHQANDNIETVLMNFFRGTGISGLHGILPRQNHLIRPLLFAKRETIEQFAKENGVAWVEDSSNASTKYTRNFFRHEVLPLVKQVYRNAEENLSQNITRFSEAEMLYNQAVAAYRKKLVVTKGNEIQIPVLKLQQSQPLHTITWEMVKDFEFHPAQVADIITLLTAENGKYVSSRSHRIIRNRNWLIIAPLQTEEANHVLIEETDSRVSYESGVLTLQRERTTHPPSADANMAILNAKEIVFPLLLRKWKTGDYFYPLGMRKKKKLSRFFIDKKLSPTEKENVWVVEMNKKIIWVIGYRIDDRFKIEESTQTRLIIHKK